MIPDEQQPAADPPAEEQAPPAVAVIQPPRLGVLHLMIWMACTAVALSGLLASSNSVSGDVSQDPFGLAMLIGAGMIFGAALAATGYLVFLWIRGDRGRWRAGHWLLVDVTMMMLFYGVLFFSSQLVMPGELGGTLFASLYMGVYLLLCLAQAFILTWGALRQPDGIAWRVTLLLAAGSWAMSGLAAVVQVASQFLPSESGVTAGEAIMWAIQTVTVMGALSRAAFFIAMIVACILRRHERNDWLHYTGVGVIGAIAVAVIVGYAGALIWYLSR